ncbi:ribosomal protein S18-alanine N-acetyltransferase [Bacteroides oleiciplenus]|uniref:[Ribosomal protein bS18]-alanine N-acetyltransferase n=2 Tax=Bacteroides oleiciplenus TaxID=626931 RepID=K9EA64_9BACE|nr:ribosomal protein S18-alanine N-acetyltransferase [Bacteroides oleiciplenus]EKU92726.1 ribosomal-protein-alanine acetyltransferase [Bacteroides oleiciplenus YIT 12058]RGN37169.1 ribosomal-protein-alanine N-acetyltransferase [Bacteroides oleiciplenus]
MKREFGFRLATVADISSIMEIELICFGQDSFSKRQFIYLISRAQGRFLVVESQGKIAGYLSLLINKRAHSLRIYSLAVHPVFRGKGVGQLLIERAVAVAYKKSLGKITLEVNVSNFSAIQLYEKNGFECVGIRKNYYHDGTDAHYMQKSVANT